MLEQKMMDEWSQLPMNGRVIFRDWAKAKIVEVLETSYGVK